MRRVFFIILIWFYISFLMLSQTKTFKYSKSEYLIMNKRGLSPLMATLLLIGFSVALGTIVMNWGQGYIEEKAEFVQSAHAAEVGCENVDAKVVTIAGHPQLCKENGDLKIFLENLANMPLEGMQLRLTGLDDFRVIDNVLAQPLGGAQSVHVRGDVSDLGVLVQVKLTPMITSGEVSQFCLRDALVFEQPFSSC